MKKILIVIDYYLPGYKAGGSQRTVENICEAYKEKSDIYILTLNHDMGVDEPYDVPIDAWIKKYGVNIMYVNDKNYKYALFKKLYCQFDDIYTCSLFARSTYTFMLVNHRANMGMHNFYVAPMGVFSEGAMASKNLKKKLFLKVFSLVHIYKTVIWSLSSKEEYKDIVREIGQKKVRRYVIAEDLPGKVDYNQNRNNYHNKIPDKIDVVFLS